MSLVPRNINFDEVWNQVRVTVCDILTLNSIPRQIWNDRFSDIYALCVARPTPFTSQLYEETRHLIIDHLKGILEHLEKQAASNFLEVYQDVWLKYEDSARKLNQLYIYFNQHQLKLPKQTFLTSIYNERYQSMSSLEIEPICFLLWKETILIPLASRLKNELICSSMLQKLTQHLDTKVTEEIKTILRSLRLIDYYRKNEETEMYNDIFEKPYLSACVSYYEADAMALFANNSMAQCLSLIMKKLTFEINSAEKYLPEKTITKLNDTFNTYMLGNHLDKFEASSEKFIEKMDEENLRLMYLLLKPIKNGHKSLQIHMATQIERQGFEAISDLNQELIHVQFIEKILSVYKLYSDFIRRIFDNDVSFSKMLEKRLKVVVNQGSVNGISKSPEYLAKYWNELLKQDVKCQVSNDVLEEKLTVSLVIFRLVNDKDIFQKYLSRIIAKRLIMNNPNSHAIESIISKLKTACGHSFTTKLHQMYSDVAINQELNKKLVEYLENNVLEETKMINFHINVLQNGAWPFNRCALEIPLPDFFLERIQIYEKFYRSQFSGRKLIWLHHMETVDVQLNYLSKPYIVTMQIFQYLILLQLDITDTMVVADILKVMKIGLEQFRIFVFGLLQLNILKSGNDSEEIDESSEVVLNRKFSNNRMKFRIPQGMQKNFKGNESTMKISNSIEIDRKCYLEAAIVRVMKLHRMIQHSALVKELISISQPLFMPSLSLIKVCIEKLIDGRYIERSADKPDHYRYLA